MSLTNSFDVSLGLEGTHALITGGCGLIGRVVTRAFLAAGCKVTVVDLPGTESGLEDLARHPSLFFTAGDVTKDMPTAFFAAENRWRQPVQVCVALASLDLSVLPQCESLAAMDPAVWQRVLDVNVGGTFATCQQWLKGCEHTQDSWPNMSCILMGSESGTFGVRTQAAYAAGKAAVQYGLLQSLAKDAPRVYPGARVNAVAPGAVDTERFKDECERYGREWRYEECEATVALARPVQPEDVARTILFLASERFSGGISGQIIPVDCGKAGSVVWKREEVDARKA